MTDMGAESQVQLTVAIVLHGAAPGLAATIASLGELADELLIVDAGADGAARNVAQHAGARIVTHAWNHDFAGAHNAGSRGARGDWVLWLESGERIEQAEAAALRQFVEVQAQPGTIYLTMLQTAAHAAGAWPEQVAEPRLTPVRPDLRFVGRARPKPQGPEGGVRLPVALAPGRILRDGPEHSREAIRQRAQLELKLWALELESRGRLPATLLALGSVCETLGETAEAREWYRDAVAVAEPGSAVMLEGFYGLLTSIAGPQASAEQLAIVMQALETFPLDAQLLCAAAGCLHNQGRRDLACRAYETAVRHGQISLEITAVKDLPLLAALCLATLHQQAGSAEDAIAALEEAVGRHGCTPQVHRRLTTLYVQRGEWDRASRHVDALTGTRRERMALRLAVRGACDAVREMWEPARSALARAYEQGCRDVICLEWLVKVQIALCHWDSARETLAVWRSIEPRSSEMTRLAREIPQPRSEEPSASEGIQHRVDGPDSLMTRSRPETIRVKFGES